MKEESGQSAEQPNGVPAAENVENTTREAEIVETENERTKKQMAEAKEDLQARRFENVYDDPEEEEEDFYGDKDTEKEFLIPGVYKNKPGIVIVEQKRLVDVDGTKRKQAVDAQIPIQIYSTKVFDIFSKPDRNGETDFDRQGLKVRELHRTAPAKKK